MSRSMSVFRVKERTRAIKVTGEKPKVTKTYQQIVDDHKEAQLRIAMRGFQK